MSEYNEQVLKLMDILKTKKFLFPKTMPQRMKLGLYFEWFENHLGYEFNQMPAMVHFKPEILDQFTGKVVWTGFSLTDPKSGAYGLHTLVQISKEYHIVFLYAQEENQISVIGTLYISDIHNYIKFMEENERYVIRQRARGFNTTNVGFTPPFTDGQKEPMFTDKE
jgi:hypothetical protein